MSNIIEPSSAQAPGLSAEERAMAAIEPSSAQAPGRAAIEIDGVSMKFRMYKEKVENLKEYVIKLMKRELTYETFLALDGVSFDVRKGDIFGIVGLNGSGKSTLLKIIAGILKPSSGTVSVSGTVAPLIELGAGFDFDLTARENIFLNGAVLGFSKAELTDIFDDIVAFSGLPDFLDVPLKNYSSGMVARLAFSVATIVQPDILICDEVLSVGDFHFQEKCEQRITDMMRAGATVLIVSHSADQIARLCNRALWLEKGKMRMYGAADDVCEAYKDD